MQILRAGMIVHARRHRWRVVETRAYDDCQLITLSPLGPSNRGVETQLLVPFDAVEPIHTPRQLRIVRTPRWRRACRDLLSRGFSEAHLRAAAGAHIDLLPYQLEPAIALIRGHGCRLLLADDVGLGKTIQAGIAIAELRARGAADRVLIVTPAGLRDQWAEELWQRFDINADLVDVRGVARRVSALPYGVNPWTTWPIAIASIDYVKRAEVLPAVAACAWDAIVVDEAHGLAGDSDRHEAVAALAARAAYVILLTATPHNGDARAFRSLCAIGGRGDRLLVFRRTRDAIHPGARRRVHRLLVQPSDHERRMHALLVEFSRAVRAERGEGHRDMWLALAVLHKRAYSSARALQQTIARRLAAMEPESDVAAQLALPLDALGESDATDEAPRWQPIISLRDRARERSLLTALAAAAEAAAGRETKLSALSRLLKRVAEPVIVFTEFRDTLARVARAIDRPAGVLHGGLSRQERAAALRAFAEGEPAILLATDAAGEGLNLQRSCRTVINLELPWNPMRLEQRIGRVDRIGQHRPVHVFHLIAAGSGEHRLLGELQGRIVRARMDIGVPNPLGDAGIHDDIDVDQRAAKLAIDDAWVPAAATAGQPREWPGIDQQPSYQADAVLEARRVETERALKGTAIGKTATQSNDQSPLAATVRNAGTRRRLGGRILTIWEAGVEDGCGRCVLSETIAISVALTQRPHPRIDIQWLERFLSSVAPHLLPLVDAAAAPCCASAISSVSMFIATRVARERRIAAMNAPRAFQQGLFDRRAHHAQAAAHSARQQIALAGASRVAILERCAELSKLPPMLRLVLVP